MDIAISSCFTKNELLTADDVACITDAGIRFIELASFHYWRPEYADLLGRNGVELSHWHLPMLDISAPDVQMRSSSVETLIRELNAIAPLMRGKIAILHPGNAFTNEEERPARFTSALASIAEIAKAAQDAGITLAIENMLAIPHMIGDSPSELYQLLADLGRDEIGVCIDTGHANVNGGLEDYFNLFGKRILAFHLHDNYGKKESVASGMEDLHLFCGDGTVDWDAVRKNIHDIGFDGIVTFEVDFKRRDISTCDGMQKCKRFFAERIQPPPA